MSQLRLLMERRFWPLFWTQFLGAFNDNVFKNALVIMIAYRALDVAGVGSQQLVVACAGVFILPFFLFSATAGQLADRVPKSRLMRWVKLAEIGIMGVGAVGFWWGSVPLLLAVLFLMGLQSTFFGPAKFSVLPELLDERSLVGGNALISAGTFLSILLGTIVGGLFIAGGPGVERWVGAVVVAVAGCGFAASLAIPGTAAASPDLGVDPNPLRPTLDILRTSARVRSVFLSILGISWFWFLGVSFLSLLPSFSKDVLHGAESVVTLFLAVFCVGIGVGSMLCERLSRRRLELGLVPLGSIGISLFALDLALASRPFGAAFAEGALLPVVRFLSAPGGLRVALDLFGLAVFSGFYTVPLVTLVQQRSATAERSRVIAGNNILNALFMVVSSVLLVALLAAGVSIPWIFVLLALLNLAVAAYIYTVIPEFLLRFVAWMLAHVLYRLELEGDERIPDEGPAVLVANHVSFVDWLLVASASARPVRFVMDHAFMRVPVLKWLFRDARVIPIAPARDDPALLEEAFDRIAAELADGELVCVFPEGRITRDGRMAPFRPGVERIVERTPVPAVPIALVGMWGSFFSRHGGAAMRRPFRRVWSRVRVEVGEPVPPEAVSAHDLALRVAALGGFEPPEPYEDDAPSALDRGDRAR